MKSILQGSKEKKTKVDNKYPYLGIFNDGVVIFFVGPKRGTIVHKPESTEVKVLGKICEVGEDGDSWSESLTEPLKGKIILEN